MDDMTEVNDETPQQTDINHRRGVTSRTVLNIISVVLVITALVGGTHWWVGPAQALWQRTFPPPPYTGSIIVSQTDTELIGLRMSDGTVQWRIGTPASYAFNILKDNMIYNLRTSGTQITAISVADGKTIWRYKDVNALNVSINFIDSAHLYLTETIHDPTPGAVGLIAGPLIALDRQTGKIAWKSDSVGFQDTLTFTGVLGSLILPSYNPTTGTFTLQALNSQTGQKLWKQQVLKPASGNQGFGYGTSALGNNIFVEFFVDGKDILSLYDGQTGVQLWQKTLYGSSFAYDAKTIYFSTGQRNSDGTDIPSSEFLVAINTADGTERWKIPGSYNPVDDSFVPLTGKGTTPLVLSDGSKILGLDRQTGAPLWTLNNYTPGKQYVVGVEDENHIIYFLDDTHLNAIDATNGQHTWSETLNPMPSSIGLIPQQGKLYAIAYYRHLALLDTNTGKVLWQHIEKTEQQVLYPLSRFGG